MKFEVGERIRTVTNDRWYNDKIGTVYRYDNANDKYIISLETMGLNLGFKESELRKY